MPASAARPQTANRVVFRLLLALVVLAPLPLGANRPWAWTLLAVLVALLLAAWSGAVMAGAARQRVAPSRLWPMALPFALALAWAALQASGLLASAHHPLWDEAARALAGEQPAPPQSSAVSVDPALTWTAILRLGAYGGIFWLAVQLGRDRARAREALVGLASAGLAYAAYGLAAFFASGETILWMTKWAYGGDLTATFVNRNAYGAYAGLGLLCCLALLVRALRASARDRSSLPDIIENLLTSGPVWAVGVVVMATVLLLSHSRGALLATGVALLALLAALAAGRVASSRAMLATGAVILLAGLALATVSGDATLKRLSENNAIEDERVDLSRLTLGAIIQAPLTGHGLGTFEPAFHIYRDATLSAPVVYSYAHDMWLETAMDLGVPGAVLLLGATLAACLTCLRGLRRRHRDQIYPATALAGAVLFGVHGLLDFSVQMPANAATLALLLGIGVTQSWSTGRRHGEDLAEDGAPEG